MVKNSEITGKGWLFPSAYVPIWQIVPFAYV